ncbi:Dihydroneopterin aldolase [Methanosarcina barkeri 227]|uniref:Dihydroneopterin aldolase n=2 Tax=Methanosarcina barkeri TaxID=2208 RepID=A0A0E3QPH2_METBA|nr:dihydroneopterin aldolase family protein [Methanosarcina barkeri]AKB53120.1 Dihydroneopterin aldolase [Methanosarcina barkeri MS]AKB58774.1 Dihydroneopterin aldolase [Methanosarcina barkeri 227]
MVQEKVTDRDNAIFEAGIKLGALYHQFTGSPVNLNTVSSLEQAIQKSISVQPYVEEISVKIDRDMLKSKLNDEFGYSELQGPMLKVKITVRYGPSRIKVGMEYDPELNYPLMKILEIEEIHV